MSLCRTELAMIPLPSHRGGFPHRNITSTFSLASFSPASWLTPLHSERKSRCLLFDTARDSVDYEHVTLSAFVRNSTAIIVRNRTTWRGERDGHFGTATRGIARCRSRRTVAGSRGRAALKTRPGRVWPSRLCSFRRAYVVSIL